MKNGFATRRQIETGHRTDAEVAIMVYFTDREPAVPFNVSVPARRTVHLRFNDFREPGTIPPSINFASTITSSVPVVVQHTRFDSRSGPIALMTTTAYSGR